MTRYPDPATGCRRMQRRPMCVVEESRPCCQKVDKLVPLDLGDDRVPRPQPPVVDLCREGGASQGDVGRPGSITPSANLTASGWVQVSQTPQCSSRTSCVHSARQVRRGQRGDNSGIAPLVTHTLHVNTPILVTSRRRTLRRCPRTVTSDSRQIVTRMYRNTSMTLAFPCNLAGYSNECGWGSSHAGRHMSRPARHTFVPVRKHGSDKPQEGQEDAEETEHEVALSKGDEGHGEDEEDVEHNQGGAQEPFETGHKS
jgi:hypothetical protein